MGKINLTSRQKSIIEILTFFTAQNPVTISGISERLNISSRTVLREMPSIEKWLNIKGFHFERKPGVGLVLNESVERQQLLLKVLEEEDIEIDYSKEERKKMIICELLSLREPLKSFYFTSKFKISEGTLSNYLEDIGKWLKAYNITVVRKQGLGIYIEGNENSLRQAITNILYDTLDEKEMIEIINGKMSKDTNNKIEVTVQNRLLNFMDKSVIKNIEDILTHIEEKLEIKYADSAHIGLIVHLSLAIKRIQNNEKISMEKKALEELMLLPEFAVGATIAQKLEKAFEIKIPNDEIGYITMHLKGAKLRLKNLNGINIEEINMIQLVRSMVWIVEKELGIELKNSSNLVEDLSNHLVPAISRLSMNLKIKNPQLANIRENYNEIFRATKKSCEMLKKVAGVDEVPESEVAYIAMHFGAAIANEGTFDNEISVVIVCPTGIGTSKLLAIVIEKEFHNIKVKSIISAINIDIEKLKLEGIDLIISTVELSVDYDYICVNPLLLEGDKLLLKNKMKNFIKKGKTKKPVHKIVCRKNEIIEISMLGSEIVSLLDDIRLNKTDSVDCIDSLYKESSLIFAKSKFMANEINENFIKREKLGNTYLEEFKMMLLHCKSKFVKGCKFGILRLEKILIDDERQINGALILIVPDSTNTIYSEIISELSGALIEDAAFLDIIQTQNEDMIKEKAERRLSRYYVKKLKERMEMFKND